MNLPNDPNILLSVVNTALRDGASIEDFCAERECDVEELEARLAPIGVRYDAEKRRFY